MTKQKKVNPKTAAAKSALIALSQAMQENQKVIEAMTGDCPSVNELLIEHYKTESNCKTFKTFHQWKAEGYKVKKGEKAYRVWGSPLKAKKAAEDNEQQKDEEKKYKFWPMCSLFNESQVEPLTDKPESDSKESEDKPENKKTETEGQQEAEERATAFVPNEAFVCADYEEKQEAKIERLENRAARLESQSNACYERSHALVEHIPMGQPVLVGHHSEAGHRRAVNKSWGLMGKSVQLDKKAAATRSRAAGVGTGGISSNDPKAFDKLQGKLDKLIKRQEMMKSVNKIVRAKGDDKDACIAAIVDAGLLNEKLASEKVEPDHCGRVGFASYELSNNNAEINRLKKRIAGLKALHGKSFAVENDGFSGCINNGQVQFDFKGGKPSEEARKLLKSYAFKWSRYQGAWVRKVTNNAVCAAEVLVERLNKLEAIY